jgi:predicted nuclease of predicted toxin-antitoxin system
VRILIDEQLPRQLVRRLSGHHARTVQQCGWAGLRNGELLLRAAAMGFDVLLTADQNLTYQQNLAGSPLGVVVLMTHSSKLENLLPLVPAILAAVQGIRPGEVRQVGS